MSEDEATDIDRTSFSTESEYGQQYLRQAGIGCWLAGGLVIGMGTWTTFRRMQVGNDLMACVPIVCLTGLIAVGIILIPRLYARGTWELDDERIRFVPLQGASKELKWPEIDAVIWDDHRAGVKGHGVKIVIPWALIDPKERPAAQQYLGSRLGPHFDLNQRDTSVLAWTILSIYAAGLAAIELSLIPFWLCASVLLLVGAAGCFLKSRREPTWRLRASDH